MAGKKAKRVEAAWMRLKRGSTELTSEALCERAKVAGHVVACDSKNLVLVNPNGLRLVAMTDGGHFDQATAERVVKALRDPADY